MSFHLCLTSDRSIEQITDIRHTATDEKMDTIPELILEERDGQGIQEQIDEKIRNFDIPYDSSQEPLPRVPAYHSCFARVEKHYEELLEAAMKALGSSNYRDDATDRLSRECTKRRKVQYPNAHIVGLVGDSGVGKIDLA